MKEIKSRRGVYYDLDKSPFFVCVRNINNYDIYKFSSEYKTKVFKNRISKECAKLDKFLKSLCNVGCKDAIPLIAKIASKVYKNMLYK